LPIGIFLTGELTPSGEDDPLVLSKNGDYSNSFVAKIFDELVLITALAKRFIRMPDSIKGLITRNASLIEAFL